MNNYEIIGLFAEASLSRRRPSSFLVSTLFHGVALGALSYGLLKTPTIKDPVLTERYSVRHLELHSQEPQRVDRHGDQSLTAAQSASEAEPPVDRKDSSLLMAQATLPAGGAGHQTIVQPEFHSHMALSEETPIPTIVLWTPELASTQRIVAATQDKASAAKVAPSLDLPNEELDLADNSVTAIDSTSNSMTAPVGTTSPVRIASAEQLKMAPTTMSDSNEQPTPTALLSLSDIRMLDGEVILPPVNEMKSSVSSTTPAEPAKVASPLPHSEATKTTTAIAAGNRTFNPSDKPATTPESVLKADNPKPDTEHDPETESPASESEESAHLMVPMNGRFGVVVVGASLAEQYPEAPLFWNDRVAYTAYLHVGLSKNWILQYSILRSAETTAGGIVSRVEAPWPYDIWRPNLVSRDLNADALMVHGVLNQAGKLETLAIAFPLHFARATFVLRALQRWQFRPARQNGRAIAVEVLLIIPDELD